MRIVVLLAVFGCTAQPPEAGIPLTRQDAESPDSGTPEVDAKADALPATPDASIDALAVDASAPDTLQSMPDASPDAFMCVPLGFIGACRLGTNARDDNGCCSYSRCMQFSSTQYWCCLVPGQACTDDGFCCGTLQYPGSYGRCVQSGNIKVCE